MHSARRKAQRSGALRVSAAHAMCSRASVCFDVDCSSHLFISDGGPTRVGWWTSSVFACLLRCLNQGNAFHLGRSLSDPRSLALQVGVGAVHPQFFQSMSSVAELDEQHDLEARLHEMPCSRVVLGLAAPRVSQVASDVSDFEDFG